MTVIAPIEQAPAAVMWQRLSRLEMFQGFSEEQRDAFLHAYEHEASIGLRRFASGELICRKGEYELDLCFILSGTVDLFGEDPARGRALVATLPAGRFYGELGAMGGLPRT